MLSPKNQKSSQIEVKNNNPSLDDLRIDTQEEILPNKTGLYENGGLM